MSLSLGCCPHIQIILQPEERNIKEWQRLNAIFMTNNPRTYPSELRGCHLIALMARGTEAEGSAKGLQYKGMAEVECHFHDK